MTRVAVFGVGYVGCVTAACLARDGSQVIGVDVDASKVDELNAGESPVLEPGLGELVHQSVFDRRLRATTDAAEAVAATEIALICVGTPSAEDGSLDTAAVERVVEVIGQALRAMPNHPYICVVRSTLLPGVLEQRLTPLLVEAAGRDLGPTFSLCNNPEFLREGTALRDYDRPPFVLIGAGDPTAGERVASLYGRRVCAPRRIVDTRTAALVKYACNAYHAAKVCFANEIGALAASLGADGREVMALVCEDRKLNVSPAYLRPGFAFGGSCLPKDLRAMVRHARQAAIATPLLESTLASNEAQLGRAVAQVRRSGLGRIGLVGLSFKAGTDDLRESPLVRLAEDLLGRGYDLRIYDPDVSLSRLRGRNRMIVDRQLPHLARLMVDSPEALCGHAELLIVGRDVPTVPDWGAMHGGAILDLQRDLCRPPREATIAAPIFNTLRETPDSALDPAVSEEAR